MELDTSYFDLPINTPEQMDSEIQYLIELAKNVGNYLYEYKDEYKGEPGANDKLNLGIMAQQIAKVPGLNAAVVQNPNGDGTLAVDANRLALTTIGYVATLAKLILEMRGIEYDRSDKEMVGNIQNSGRETTGNNPNPNGEAGTGNTSPNGENSNGSTNIPVETQPDKGDVYATAINGGIVNGK
jgi:hypothetical protein